jgi:hypothetical protein
MIGESHLTTACSEPEATIPPTPPPLASLYRLMYNGTLRPWICDHDGLRDRRDAIPHEPNRDRILAHGASHPVYWLVSVAAL